MMQSTVTKDTNPFEDPVAVTKIGETGDTVVYIFPGGNACVKKGKKSNTNSNQPENSTLKPCAKLSEFSVPEQFAQGQVRSAAQTMVNSRGYPPPPKPPALPPKVFGDRLVKAALITETQLQVALYDQQSTNLDLGEVLLARGWIDEPTLKQFASP